jgi:ElaB/YqjD/DUF883 family membrane-anchored ribosome-binding protein
MGKDPDAIEREIEERRERIGERIDALSYKADVKSRVGDAVAEKRDQVTGQVRELVSGAQEQVSRASDGTPDPEDVKQQTRRAAGIVRENPLGLALGAVAAGFLLGLLLPSTPMEDEKLGEAADAVKVKAAETGEEALDRGKRVAQEVAESAAQTAKESGGQHAGELAGSARGRAAEAAETARSSTEPQSGSRS